MSYMKYRPHDRHLAGEILDEFAALLIDVARKREGERQAAVNPRFGGAADDVSADMPPDPTS
jgi:hypothetical protein